MPAESNTPSVVAVFCRAADRGYPVIQIAPPLIAGEAELDELVSILRAVLEAATTFVARA